MPKNCANVWQCSKFVGTFCCNGRESVPTKRFMYFHYIKGIRDFREFVGFFRIYTMFYSEIDFCFLMVFCAYLRFLNLWMYFFIIICCRACLFNFLYIFRKFHPNNPFFFIVIWCISVFFGASINVYVIWLDGAISSRFRDWKWNFFWWNCIISTCKPGEIGNEGTNSQGK